MIDGIFLISMNEVCFVKESIVLVSLLHERLLNNISID